MSTEVRRELKEVIPAQVIVVDHVRHVYISFGVACSSPMPHRLGLFGVPLSHEDTTHVMLVPI
ncbi:hypothetical protein [Paenibacillus sp. UMB4589-SE434]|uniref:hypothetical protein n=1 Tax=Paenibacillus sp. UMB4589-SE434 TaxID=3046314 RepID=UPI00254E22AC|nr:hypothetical protein [Paenibacillus sp. UMB4589-SE434]MDK8180135.1 hypothetical protein [Paenibacillus sp. UMB4589-SE434]